LVYRLVHAHESHSGFVAKTSELMAVAKWLWQNGFIPGLFSTARGSVGKIMAIFCHV
jgi:hypothetical protein